MRVGVLGRMRPGRTGGCSRLDTPPVCEHVPCGIVRLRLRAKTNPAEQAPQDRQHAYACRRPRSRCDLVEPAGARGTRAESQNKNTTRWVVFLFWRAGQDESGHWREVVALP